MNLASIDIGSNTVLLLIAEHNNKHQLRSLLNKYRSPRISKGISVDRNISESKIDELLCVLDEYNMLTRKYDCEKTLLIGTNALRIANNSRKIIDLVKNKYKWDINVVKGSDEARLSYLGTIYPYINEPTIKTVIDIGGGSTEIIKGIDFSIKSKKSFSIGVVSITEKYFLQNPPTNDQIQNAIQYINEEFSELQHSIEQDSLVYAVAGTPTTLSSIKQNLKEYKEDMIDESIISLDDINNIYNNLVSLSPNQILENYGSVVKGREDVLLAGTIILKIIMDFIKCKEINVSTRGLRYGIIVDYIINELKMPIK